MSGGVPAGWVLVPVEPTEAMVDRFVSRALCVSVHGDGGWSKYARQQWATMLAATPTLPIEGRDADVERAIHSAIVEWCDGGPIHPHRLAGLSRRIAAALQALGERGCPMAS